MTIHIPPDEAKYHLEMSLASIFCFGHPERQLLPVGTITLLRENHSGFSDDVVNWAIFLEKLEKKLSFRILDSPSETQDMIMQSVAAFALSTALKNPDRQLLLEAAELSLTALTKDPLHCIEVIAKTVELTGDPAGVIGAINLYL